MKLLALDLDGTTLNASRRFSPVVRAALQRLQGRHDCHTVFITGRRTVDMQCLQGYEGLCRHAVLNNGAMTLGAGGRVEENNLIEPPVARQVIAFCLAHGIQLNICTASYWGVNIIEPGVLAYGQAIGRRPALFTCLEGTPWQEVEGFTATQGSEALIAWAKEKRLPLSWENSEPGCYDIHTAGASKWQALCRLAQRLDVPRPHILAAGNYYNDLEMITGAGVGIAVANAPEDIRAKADYVTLRTNDQDAVAEIADRFFPEAIGGAP